MQRVVYSEFLLVVDDQHPKILSFAFPVQLGKISLFAMSPMSLPGHDRDQETGRGPKMLADHVLVVLARHVGETTIRMRVSHSLTIPWVTAGGSILGSQLILSPAFSICTSFYRCLSTSTRRPVSISGMFHLCI